MLEGKSDRVCMGVDYRSPEVDLLKVEVVAPRVSLSPGNPAPGTFFLSLPSWLLRERVAALAPSSI